MNLTEVVVASYYTLQDTFCISVDGVKYKELNGDVLQITEEGWVKIQQSPEAKCPRMPTLSRLAARNIRRNTLRRRSISPSSPRSVLSDGR